MVFGVKNIFDNKNCLHYRKIGYKMQAKYRSKRTKRAKMRVFNGV